MSNTVTKLPKHRHKQDSPFGEPLFQTVIELNGESIAQRSSGELYEPHTMLRCVNARYKKQQSMFLMNVGHPVGKSNKST
eukprot:6416729-Amphidinium_carterae.1